MEERRERSSCAVEATLKAIGGRWKVLILRELFEGTQRFNELHRRVRGITQKVLAQQLREMERDGLVRRKVYPEIPPKVEYSLTELGRSLRPVLDALHQWGVHFLQQSSSNNLGTDRERESERSGNSESPENSASSKN